jgi:hypothetical protein
MAHDDPLIGMALIDSAVSFYIIHIFLMFEKNRYVLIIFHHFPKIPTIHSLAELGAES